MRIGARLAVFVSLSLGLVAAAWSPPATRAAPAVPAGFGALLLHATDLGSGYYDQGGGYQTRSTILQPGMPVPGQAQLIKAHGFAREYFTSIWSRRVVHNFVATIINEAADQFTSTANAHWALLWARDHSRETGLYQQRISLPAVGDESFGMLPPGGNPGRGIIFRQGRYVVELTLNHHPAQPGKLVQLARLVASRLKASGA